MRMSWLPPLCLPCGRLVAPTGGSLLSSTISIPGGSAYCYLIVHLNPSYNEPASPTRPVNDRPSRFFPPPPRRRQFSAGDIFDAPTSDTDPFTQTNHLHDHSQPPVHPDLRTGAVSSPTIVPTKPQLPPLPTTPPAYPHHASNPFVARAAAAAAKLNPSPERKLPPLPPRKVPPLLPPRSAPPSVSIPSAAPSKPPPPPPAKVPHLTTALMQQSLQASKAGQEAKRIETQREQKRVLQVLKSSTQSGSPPKRPGIGGGNPRSSSMDGAGPTTPVLPPRPRVSPTASVASTRSFEQVAGAGLASRRPLRRSPSPLRPRSLSRPRTHSPSSPSRTTTDLPPPVHPNRNTTQVEYTTDSTATFSPPSARLGRSKSAHHSSPPPVPRRRRPDSVQLLPSPGAGSSTQSALPVHTPPATSASTGTFPRLTRNLSLSAREPLWDDMRGTLSAVRYKAEAGFSRRGWVPGLDRDERLIAQRRDSEGPPSASSSEDGLGVDAESLETERRRRGSLERDEMKWPAGSGWKPLA